MIKRKETQHLFEAITRLIEADADFLWNNSDFLNVIKTILSFLKEYTQNSNET